MFTFALAVSAVSMGLSTILSGGGLADDLAAWAGPINTALLILLWVIQHRRSGQVDQKIDSVHTDLHATAQQTAAQIENVHADVQSAAQAAASAAQAAGHTARIAQDIGGSLRHTDAPGGPGA